MRLKFDANLNTKFINAYRANECLWRPDNDQYRDKYWREKAIESIVTTMKVPGLTAREVKKKIKGLRSTYLIEVKKIKESEESGADRVYKPTISWFSQMDAFIKPILRNINTNVNETTNTNDDTEQDNNDDLNAADNNRTTPSPEVPATAPKRKRFTEIRNDTQMRERSKHNTIHQEDEFEIFGRHVISQLRQLSLEQAVIAQEEIQSTLSRCRLQDIRSQNSERHYILNAKQENFIEIPTAEDSYSQSSSVTKNRIKSCSSKQSLSDNNS